MNASIVDLFCGAGGLTCGLEQAGLSVSSGVDIDPECRYPYEENTDADFVQADLATVARENPERVARLFDSSADVKILAGCAPCQPFSPLNHGGESHEHDKWGLLQSFRELVKYVRPEVVAMENVYEVRNHDVYEEFVEALEDLDYHINDDENKRVYCPEYGIPQKRKRWILLASREGPIELKEPTHPDEDDYPTAKDALDHLPELEAGEVDPDDQLHQSRNLSETNLERIRISEPGETWELWKEEGREDLLLKCHQKSSGSSFKAPYGRMSPDEPAPTVTTQFYNYGSGRFGHYDTEQNRALSLREGAVLQTFPEEYRFFETLEDMKIRKAGQLIGNAVPPKLGEVIGESIMEHLAI